MKIAYLSTFYPFRGGIAQFNAALFNTFEDKHRIKAYTFSRQYPNILFPGTSQMVGENDPAEKIPAMRCLDTINPFTYGYTAKRINKFAPDLMLTKFWMPFFGPSLGWVAKKLEQAGTTNISILDNVIPHEKRPGDMAFTKFFLKHNHGFVVMSESVKNDLLSLKPDARFLFHPHPLYDHFGDKIDKIKAKEALNISPDKKTLLFFGFIRGYKGLDLLLETLNILPEDYHLIIAGEVYGNFDKYEALIQKYNLEGRISKNVRYIGDNEVPTFFSAADLCVLPYKSATQSGIVGISYHFDLPVIATDVGGLGEMITPHQTGMIIEKPDIDSIKQTIQEYFSGSRQDEFIANIHSYKEKYNWETLAQGILDFYETL